MNLQWSVSGWEVSQVLNVCPPWQVSLNGESATSRVAVKSQQHGGGGAENRRRKRKSRKIKKRKMEEEEGGVQKVKTVV